MEKEWIPFDPSSHRLIVLNSPFEFFQEHHIMNAGKWKIFVVQLPPADFFFDFFVSAYCFFLIFNYNIVMRFQCMNLGNGA